MAEVRILVRLLNNPELKSEPIDEEAAKEKLVQLSRIYPADTAIFVQITDTIVVRRDQLVSVELISAEASLPRAGSGGEQVPDHL